MSLVWQAFKATSLRFWVFVFQSSFVDTIIMHHGLPSRRTRARWTQNKQKTMRNASALHNFSTLDEPGHCIADSFPRSSCSFDFFSLSDRWMEVEQDISDCSTAILDWKLLVIIYISSIRHKKSIKFLSTCTGHSNLVRRVLSLLLQKGPWERGWGHSRAVWNKSLWPGLLSHIQNILVFWSNFAREITLRET